MEASSSSSSSLSNPTMGTYDVFISFRGEDTRDNFTSHLHAALLRKNVETYIDDDKLGRGDEISPALMKAIEESKLSVVILSENYAFSSWCLDELVHILRCKMERRQFVIPVFYRMDPSAVRKQLGSLVAERFKDRMDKVQEWKAALKTIANLAGWNSRVTRPESKLVTEIVKDIVEKLSRLSSVDETEGLIGIDKRIKQIEKISNACSKGDITYVIGIWGMGGIGKSTLARVLFKRFYSRFDGCCFLSDVREETKKQGLQRLKRKLFSELLEEDLNGSKFIALTEFFQSRLHRKRVLIVLDDVNDLEQIKVLVGRPDNFGRGSRIIVVTRDVEVLRNITTDERIYKVEELDYDEALQLFCLNAFGKTCSPSPPYTKLSKVAINYAGGVPLALEVLGSSLCSKSEKTWETTLDKLKKFPLQKIQNVLEISYEGLDDDNEQSIFLDIACFFKGENRDFVERILTYSHAVIDKLIYKSLITITPGNKLWMHDLIQEMGWEIVRKESIHEPGKRSRLWIARDICHVLKNNTGTDLVQGMFFDISQIKEISFSPAVFQKMCNLRLLKIYSSTGMKTESKVYLSEELRSLSDKLVYLEWDGYPSTSLPVNFTPENLVELVMPNSWLKQLWNEDQHLDLLKNIDLRNCNHLTKIPELLHAENLTTVNLEGCSSIDELPELPRNIRSLNLSKTSVKHVPSSIGYLSQLEMFDLTDCRDLESLPTSICKLKSLQSLYLSGCSNFTTFPEILEPMERLVELELDRTAIQKLHSSIENLVALETLHLEMCEDLEDLPDSIHNISSLDYVSLWRCSKFKPSPQPCLPPEEPVVYCRPSETQSSSGRILEIRRRSFATRLMGFWDDSHMNYYSPRRRFNYFKRVLKAVGFGSSHSHSIR